MGICRRLLIRQRRPVSTRISCLSTPIRTIPTDVRPPSTLKIIRDDPDDNIQRLKRKKEMTFSTTISWSKSLLKKKKLQTAILKTSTSLMVRGENFLYFRDGLWWSDEDNLVDPSD
ncbi:Uncharacterized protein Fot_10429 [Forsythia ovata]|uniref:Uncharacterized protein n=1 Tax=Forsythia ovata TaxID=205694 RepID=A0ABD1WGU4_9LAMI